MAREKAARPASLLPLTTAGTVSADRSVGIGSGQGVSGIVQGGALSPLLCNLALHPLDLAAARAGLDSQAGVFADNGPDLLRLLDDVARDRVGQLLRAVTGVSWANRRRHHLARLPRGFWTWEVPGARLTVLSSLAPHAPTR